jgi:hypothetical protein
MKMKLKENSERRSIGTREVREKIENKERSEREDRVLTCVRREKLN